MHRKIIKFLSLLKIPDAILDILNQEFMGSADRTSVDPVVLPHRIKNYGTASVVAFIIFRDCPIVVHFHLQLDRLHVSSVKQQIAGSAQLFFIGSDPSFQPDRRIQPAEQDLDP